MTAASLLTDWARMTRTLEVGREGLEFVQIQGVLKDVTAEQVAGGMDQDMKLFTCTQAALDTLTRYPLLKNDRIRDGSEKFSVVHVRETRAGASQVFVRAEVMG